MKVTTITVGRIRNLGNYENRRIEMTAELSETEDVMKVTRELVKLVDKAQGIRVKKIGVEVRD